MYNNIKLQSILSFVAMLANINVDDLLNITKYGKPKVTIFEMLEMISEKKKR